VLDNMQGTFVTANRNASRAKSNLSVLLVDSEEKGAHMMAFALNEAGLSPVIATSGEEAIRLLGDRAFDFAIVDEQLVGVINSADIVRKAESLTPQVPVVLTGFGGLGDERRALPGHVSSYIPKPFDPQKLCDEVREVIVTLSEAPARRATTTVPPPFRARRKETAISETDVAVMVVESDASIRGAVMQALAAIGCRVVAFASCVQAEHHVRHKGFGVLVARADVLEANPHWRALAMGEKPLGSIAIVRGECDDERVRAAYLGARGAFGPPFEPTRLAAEFRQALAIMRDETRRHSSSPPPASL